MVSAIDKTDPTRDVTYREQFACNDIRVIIATHEMGSLRFARPDEQNAVVFFGAPFSQNVYNNHTAIYGITHVLTFLLTSNQYTIIKRLVPRIQNYNL